MAMIVLCMGGSYLKTHSQNTTNTENRQHQRHSNQENIKSVIILETLTN